MAILIINNYANSYDSYLQIERYTYTMPQIRIIII